MLNSFLRPVGVRCLFFRIVQQRFYYKQNDGVLSRRTSRRVLANTRRELGKTSQSSNSSRTVLLPPYLSPGELRILLGVDYKTALSLCQIKLFYHKYFWRDLEGRFFETTNKRKILVQYGSAANAVKVFGFSPVMVDPEPVPTFFRDPAVSNRVVLVWGSFVNSDPQLIFHGSEITVSTSPFGRGTIPSLTLLLMDGRSSLAQVGRCAMYSDLVVCLGEDQDWLEGLKINGKVIAMESGCDWSLVESVVAKELETVGSELNNKSGTDVPDLSAAVQFKNEKKRTDMLVDADKEPTACGVILDVTKTAQEGTTAEVLIQKGSFRIGQNFTAGTGFGKITNIYTMNGGKSIKEAGPGQLVRVGRLIRHPEYTGDFAPDDFLFVLPKERAWRLAFHRQRIEELGSFQTKGDKLETAFQLDGTGERGVDGLEQDADQVEDDHAGSPKRKASLTKEERERLQELEQQKGSILISPLHEQAELESKKVVSRWSKRQLARIEAKRLQVEREMQDKQDMATIRNLLHGKGETYGGNNVVEGNLSDPKELTHEPLPKSLPVIPLIVKTKSIAQFEQLMDELEHMQSEFEVKLPVVHGGIGPVTPNDVIHAEIEGKFAPCPVYSLDAGTLPQCTSDTVEVAEFASLEDLLGNLRQRIVNLKKRNFRNKYANKLSSSVTR